MVVVAVELAVVVVGVGVGGGWGSSRAWTCGRGTRGRGRHPLASALDDPRSHHHGDSTPICTSTYTHSLRLLAAASPHHRRRLHVRLWDSQYTRRGELLPTTRWGTGTRTSSMTLPRPQFSSTAPLAAHGSSTRPDSRPAVAGVPGMVFTTTWAAASASGRFAVMTSNALSLGAGDRLKPTVCPHTHTHTHGHRGPRHVAGKGREGGGVGAPHPGH
jgi:hypothetical protein